jgi:hypothetical protein
MKGKAKKNEALKWKSNFCIALKTLFQEIYKEN